MKCVEGAFIVCVLCLYICNVSHFHVKLGLVFAYIIVCFSFTFVSGLHDVVEISKDVASNFLLRVHDPIM